MFGAPDIRQRPQEEALLYLPTGTLASFPGSSIFWTGPGNEATPTCS